MSAVVAACGAAGDEDSPAEARHVVTPPPLAKGTLPFQTPHGAKPLEVEVDGSGHAWIGDMGFGSLGDQHVRSIGPKDTSLRWPDGVVRWAFDEGSDPPVSAKVRDNFAQVAAYIHERIPNIRFEKVAPDLQGYLLIKGQDDDGGKSDIGFQGPLVPTLMRLNPEAPFGTVLHEVGHVLGLAHEMNRADRDTFVEYCPANADTDQFQLLPWSEQDALGPYDYLSRMHYRHNQRIGADGIRDTTHCLDPDGHAWPMWPRGDTVPWQAGDQRKLSGDIDFSSGDLNVLTQLYGRGIGKPEPDDFFGEAIATADFDNDGFDDVVVAAPGDSVDGVASAGSLFVYKGNSRTPTPWRVLTGAPDSVAQTSRLGSTLAVADFNGDGFPDLAVGAPATSAAGGGYVLIYFGGMFRSASPACAAARAQAPCVADPKQDCAVCDLTTWAPLTRKMRLSAKDAAGESSVIGDHFGASLVAGDLDGDGKADLIVGSTDPNNAGRALVYSGTDLSQGNQGAKVLKAATPITGSQFGAALAVVNRDATHRALAVGAPGGVLGVGGRVYLFDIGASLALAPSTPAMLVAAGSNIDSQFGRALTSGRFVPGHVGDALIIGAPGQLNSAGVRAGAVHVYSRSDGGNTPLALRTVIHSTGAAPERFGQALAPVSGTSPLAFAIGAPQARRVDFWHATSPTGTTLSVWHQLNDPGHWGFGSAFANSSQKDLSGATATRFLVGAPDVKVGTDVSVGGMIEIEVGSTIMTHRYFQEDSKSPWAK